MHIMSQKFRVLTTVLALMLTLGFGTTSAQADEVLLTINGASGNPIKLTRAEIEALPATSFETSTIWTEGKQRFTGVALKDLLSELELSGTTIRAKALNDYSIEIPATDAIAGGPIIAYFLNDQQMSVRDKGPLWIVFPYDSDVRYQTEVFYSRSIWQLDRVDVFD